MTDGMRLLDEFRRLAEISVGAGGIHECGALTPANDRPGEHRLPGLARGRETFARQRGLIHRHGVPVQQARIRRHDVALFQLDDIARHQLSRGRGHPLSVAFHPGLGGEFRLQGGNRIARGAFFPESHNRVGAQENQNDEEIRPMLDDARQDHRGLDHPGYRTPKIGEELEERILLLHRQLIRSILCEPLCRLGSGEAVRGGCEPLLHLRNRQRFQIILGIGLVGRAGLAGRAGLGRFFSLGTLRGF